MFGNGSYRTDWDLDTQGKIMATPVVAFDVVGLETSGIVAVRFEAKPEAGEVSRSVQTVLSARAALQLSEGLRRAAEKVLTPHARTQQQTSPHIQTWA